MRSSLLLYGLYQVLKGLFQLALALFYPYTAVAGRRHLRLQGPTLVASNHPNTMIDALQSASRVNEQVFFLVNSSLFKSPFQRWFFETFYCIPIERPQDAGGRPVDNAASFERCDRHLGAGGHLFIAPEGGSELERRLRPLRTGAARIALSAENSAGFKAGVRLLPIGLNYARAEQFGSRLFVQVGEPIRAADYQEIYRHDPREAVRLLTAELDARLRSLLIDTRDEEEDQLLRMLETLLQNQRPLDQQHQFRRSQKLLDQWRASSEAEQAAFRENIDDYFRQLQKIGTTDQALVLSRTGRHTWHWMGLAAGFPAFLYGALHNFFPYFLPGKLARWLNEKKGLYLGYVSTVKLLAGMLCFPLFYGLQTYAVSQLLPSPAALVYFISLVPAGYFAHWYLRHFQGLRRESRWRFFCHHYPQEATALLRRREVLLQQAARWAGEEPATASPFSHS